MFSVITYDYNNHPTTFGVFESFESAKEIYDELKDEGVVDIVEHKE